MNNKGITCIGVIILDMLPAQLGVDFCEVTAFYPLAGGACANVAVCAARLGLQSKFIGKVGNDYFGKFLANILEKNGVNISGLCYDNERRTTMNFHAKPEPNIIQYLFYRNPGADTNLQWEDIREETLFNSSVIQIDSLCFTDEPERTTMFKIIKTAKAHNILVSFDINYRDVLWSNKEQALKTFCEIIPFSDIVKMNETEFNILFPKQPIEDGIRTLLDMGPKIGIVTLGKEGSYISNRDACVHIPILDLPVVDTLGCGDAFIAAFLSKLLFLNLKPETAAKEELYICGLYADTTASLTATKPGTIDALPDCDQVEKEFLKRMGNNAVI